MAQPSETARPSAALEAFEFGRYLRVLTKYWWIVAGTAAVVVLLTTLWTLSKPKIYEAVCTLRYDPNPPKPLGSSVEEVASTVPSYWASREFYRTQNHIIGSRTVMELVVTKLGLHQDADALGVPAKDRAGWKGVSVEDAAKMLQSRVMVDQIKETQLVLIKVRDTDPERAQVLSNAIADAYIEKLKSDRLESTDGAVKYLSERLESLREELESSEDKLHQFKKDKNVLSLAVEERQNNVAADFAKYSSALSDTRAKRVELEARLRALEALDKSDPLKVHAAALAASPAMTTLRETYRQRLAERDALSVKYGENHPEMKRLLAELQNLRSELTQEIEAQIGSVKLELREVQSRETGFKKLSDDANTAGLELNSLEKDFAQLNREKDTKEKYYRLLLDRTDETSLTKAIRISPVQIIDRALVPEFAVSPRLSVNLALGLLLGVLLGVALAFLAAQLDRSVKSVEDVENIGLPVLGVLPRAPNENSPRRVGYGGPRAPSNAPVENLDLVVHTHPMSAIAESCRSIRTNLTFMSPDKPMRAFVVTSAFPQEGKTTVAVSLAIALAQSGKRVLLIDTDLRKPRIHKAFDLPRGGGVSSVLVGEAKLDDVVQQTLVPGLWVLPCGPIPPNPSELLHTARFSALVEETLSKFDRVLFDSPPVTVVTDAAVIAPQVHGTIIVARAQKTARDALRSVLRQLGDVAAHVAGGVLNDLDPTHGEYGYGKTYYYRRYGYYYATDPEGDGGKNADAAAE